MYANLEMNDFDSLKTIFMSMDMCHHIVWAGIGQSDFILI